MRRMLDNRRHIGKHTPGVRRMPQGSATALREQPEDRWLTNRVFQGLPAVHGPRRPELLTGAPVEQLMRLPAIPSRAREGRLRGGRVATNGDARVTAESPHALPSWAGSARRENPHASISCGYGLESPFCRCR
jgi:hypothetical protein